VFTRVMAGLKKASDNTEFEWNTYCSELVLIKSHDT